MKVSDFNRRITLRAYDYSTNDYGAPIPDLKESIELWARVEDRSGFQMVNAAQVGWDYDYKITIRYQERFKSNWVVDYETSRLTINSISISNEGYKRFMILRCSFKEVIESWS